jgi:RHS repeat-associated protein
VRACRWPFLAEVRPAPRPRVNLLRDFAFGLMFLRACFGLQHAYDYENRLVQRVDTFQRPAGGLYSVGRDFLANDMYDYRSRRVWREEDPIQMVSGTRYSGASNTTTEFAGGTVEREYGAYGVLDVEYMRGSDLGGGVGGVVYALHTSGNTTTPQYYYYDGRGDVVAQVTGATNALVYQAAYDAFGRHSPTVPLWEPYYYTAAPGTEEWTASGATTDNLRSNTKQQDDDGLINEGFRYRNPENGQFLTKDPAGMIDGPNEYTYVGQNPATHFDPEGLSAYSGIGDEAQKLNDSGHPVLSFLTVLGQSAWQLASLGTASRNGAIEDKVDRGQISYGKGATAMVGNGVVAGGSLAVGGGLGGAVLKTGGGYITAGAVAGFSQAAVQSGGETTVAAATGAAPVPTIGDNAKQIAIGTGAGAVTGGLLKAAAAGDVAIANNQLAKLAAQNPPSTSANPSVRPAVPDNIGDTMDRIAQGGSNPHPRDGSVFQNRDGYLPQQPLGYYNEYVHPPPPGVKPPGPMRVVTGQGGEAYYTPDHYKTFSVIPQSPSVLPYVPPQTNKQ